LRETQRGVIGKLMIEPAEIVAAIDEALDQATLCLREHFSRQSLKASRKADTSVVTLADLASNEVISSVLRRHFPNIPIDSEEAETGSSISTEQLRWIVDPLDGTENFLIGSPHFSVAIGCALADEVLAGGVCQPMTSMRIVQSALGLKPPAEDPLSRPPSHDLADCRVSLIPHFSVRRAPFVQRARNCLQEKSWRLLDFWCPSLDWWMLSSGAIDLVIVIGRRNQFEENDIRVGRSIFLKSACSDAFVTRIEGNQSNDPMMIEIAGRSARAVQQAAQLFSNGAEFQ
jgi:myo-inositol-1(or 4)-monophosphatase